MSHSGADSAPGDVGKDLRCCISNKLPGDASPAGPGQHRKSQGANTPDLEMAAWDPRGAPGISPNSSSDLDRARE